MKPTDFLIAGLVGILVGGAAYFVSTQYLYDSNNFRANIEEVPQIEEGFDTESTDVFTDKSREDFSSPVQLNSERNSQPFTNGE